MRRRVVYCCTAVVTLFTSARGARAQAEVIGGGLAAGYTALSLAAIYHLVRPTPAKPILAGSTIDADVATPSGPARIRGRVLGMSGDSLTVLDSITTIHLARSDVRDVRVLDGSERMWAEGWGIGLVSTAAVVGTFAYLDGDDPPGDFSFSAGEKAVLGAIAGGLVGSSVGALVGLAAEHDRWAPGRWSDQRTVTITPTLRRGVGVQVGVSF